MAIEQASFYCPQCRQPRLFARKGINHVFHLVASLFLCGTWLLVWLLVALSHPKNPYHCQTCGFADYPFYLANPGARERKRTTDRDQQPGVAGSFNRILQHKDLNKVLIAFFLVSLSLIIVITLISSATSPTKPVNVVPSNPPVLVDSKQNVALTNRLTRDVTDNFNRTSWYRHIKSVSVKGDVIEVRTDSSAGAVEANKICGAVSGLYYSYDESTKGEQLHLYGVGNKLLMKRLGIGDSCR